MTERTVLRKDLRLANQSRPISINVGGINEVDGAAKFVIGKTSVITTVVGPVTPKYQKNELDTCKIEIQVNYASSIDKMNNELQEFEGGGRKDLQEQSIIGFLTSSLFAAIHGDMFPRKMIVIQVLILQDEGSVYSAALNSCLLALLDAGIPMFYYLTCVEIAVASGFVPLLDPTKEEEDTSSCSVRVCIKGKKISSPSDLENGGIEMMEEETQTDRKDDKIISVDMKGVVSTELFSLITDTACDYSNVLSNTIRESILKKLASATLY
jgi:ribonuclease PH